MFEGQGLIEQYQRRLDLWLLTPSGCWWNPQTGSPAPHPAGPSVHLKPALSSNAASVGSCCSPVREKETGTSSHSLLIISCPLPYPQDAKLPGISQNHTRVGTGSYTSQKQTRTQSLGPWLWLRCVAQGYWVVTCFRRSESCSSSFCPANSSLTSEYVSLMMARNIFWR